MRELFGPTRSAIRGSQIGRDGSGSPRSPFAPAVALLTYRGNPHSGGQGVYVRHLAHELANLGAAVEVLSGPPYPELGPEAQASHSRTDVAGHERPAPGTVRLTRVPSLDLYREPDPFRRPGLSEFGSAEDVLEYAIMCTAGFPEPLTFSLRVARLLAARQRHQMPMPDIVHDNQGLGYGLLGLQRRGLPVIATVHHAITIDRSLHLAATPRPWRRLTVRRWYGFVKMQRRVLQRLPRVLSVSSVSAAGVEQAFGLPPGRVVTVPIGVDPAVFRPRPDISRRPGRLMVVASGDGPLKGLTPLFEALAKVRAERDAHLVVVGRKGPEAGAAIKRLGIASAVTFETAVPTSRLVRLFAEAELAIVPSLYEGFSLPAVEAMACSVPVVATTGGALPEVLGPDGVAGRLVPPGDADAMAHAITTLLDDDHGRTAMGAAGRARVEGRFTWRRTAEQTIEQYLQVLASSAGGRRRAVTQC